MPYSEVTHLNEFLNYLQFQKRYSGHTISAYQTDLESFFHFVEREFEEKGFNVPPTQIRTWLASLKQEGIVSKSINRKISSLKSYYKFLLRNEKIEASPMVNIISLKVNKRLPSFIEEKDMDTLFKHVEFPDSFEGRTDLLAIKILYQCGLRRSELIGLKESQLDPGNNNLKVLGKGNKERIIPINTELQSEIKDYIKEKHEAFGSDPNAYLLVNDKGRQLNSQQVYKLVNHYLSLVSTNERKSPHILRHSFATHMTNNGADINAIKELLGHSSLASTQVYTSNSIEKLKNIHKNAHPKA